MTTNQTHKRADMSDDDKPSADDLIPIVLRRGDAMLVGESLRTLARAKAPNTDVTSKFNLVGNVLVDTAKTSPTSVQAAASPSVRALTELGDAARAWGAADRELALATEVLARSDGKLKVACERKNERSPHLWPRPADVSAEEAEKIDSDLADAHRQDDNARQWLRTCQEAELRAHQAMDITAARLEAVKSRMTESSQTIIGNTQWPKWLGVGALVRIKNDARGLVWRVRSVMRLPGQLDPDVRIEEEATGVIVSLKASELEHAEPSGTP